MFFCLFVCFFSLMDTTCLDICVFGASRINRLTKKNLKSGLQVMELILILYIKYNYKFCS